MPTLQPGSDARERLINEDMRRLLEYWDECRGEALIPTKSAIKLEELDVLIPRILVHRWSLPDRLEVEMIGTALVAEGVSELTGVNFLEFVSPASREWMEKSIPVLFETPVAALIDNRVFYKRGHVVDYTSLTLPLLDNDNQPCFLLSLEIPLTDSHPVDVSGVQAVGYELGAAYFIDIGAGCPEPVVRAGWPVQKYGTGA